jgi:hypothetical protein
MTQVDRLIRYLREHDGSSSLEITLATSIVNVTGRVSDARRAGHRIDCRKGPDKRDRYHLVEQPEQMRWTA